MENENIAYNKLPPSNRLFISLETIASALALLFSVGSLIVFFFAPVLGARIFAWLFYPTVICIATALMLGSGQLFRGYHISAVIPLVLVLASIVFIVILIVNQVQTFGLFYLPPFTFLD
ncbi:MAG: hypothetical protein IJY70_03265 [Clostridia bacterium]|nr:hypothetical protein [Clostridia bacterium]